MISVNPDWEDGHFYIGKYYDKIITTLLEDKHDKERINPAKQWSEFFCSVPYPLPPPPLPTTTLGNGQYLKVTLIHKASVRIHLFYSSLILQHKRLNPPLLKIQLWEFIIEPTLLPHRVMDKIHLHGSPKIQNTTNIKTFPHTVFRCYWIYKSHHLLRFLTKWYFKKTGFLEKGGQANCNS